jgi:putative colanic acid biosynthesis acetyltransferase WcaF
MTILDAREVDIWGGGPSFGRAHRLYRALWSMTWLLLASWTPPPFHGWRRFLLRLFGAKVASTAHVYSSARIWSPANFEIGRSSCVGPRALVYSMARITIGDHAQVSQGAHLCAGTHDISDAHFQLLAYPITIGDRAWVAADAFVGPGVSLGEGAVLGARGCAMRDLEAWMVHAGNPARPIKPRQFRTDADTGRDRAPTPGDRRMRLAEKGDA